jgi:hypothetical protein
MGVGLMVLVHVGGELHLLLLVGERLPVPMVFMLLYVLVSPGVWLLMLLLLVVGIGLLLVSLIVVKEWIRLKKVGFEPTNLSRSETMRVLFGHSFGFKTRACLLGRIRIHSLLVAGLQMHM